MPSLLEERGRGAPVRAKRLHGLATAGPEGPYFSPISSLQSRSQDVIYGKRATASLLAAPILGSFSSQMAPKRSCHLSAQAVSGARKVVGETVI